jgi:glycosyltransferase involved in cell wall biosynthesis
MDPKISIILPVYNQGRFLSEAIDSVMAQTYQDFELIIVDHSNNDISRRFAIPYLQGGSKSDPRIGYLRIGEDASISCARNSGISQATGKYTSYLYHDDSLKTGCIETLLQETQGLDGVYANTDFMDEKGLIYKTRKSREFSDAKEALQAVLFSATAPIWIPTLMVKTDILRKFPSDESFGIVEDMETLVNVLKSCRLKYVDEEVYNYRVYPGNYSSRKRLETIRGWNLLYDKHVDDLALRRYLKLKRTGITLLKFISERFVSSK